MKSAEYIGQLYNLLAGDILPTLPAHNQAVLNQLVYKFANSEGDSFQYDSESLSKKANLSQLTLRRAIRNLESMGLVEILEKGSSHKPTRYRLTLRGLIESSGLEQQKIAGGTGASDRQAIRGYVEYKPAKALSTGHITNRLSFPYNWANSNMREDTLISGVLRKNRFQDVMSVCVQYGLEKVSAVAADIKDPDIRAAVEQTLKRIRIGKEIAREESKT
jgi:hypothetical protein